MRKIRALLYLVLLFVVGFLYSCNTKSSNESVNITIDSTKVYLPEIKIKVNDRQKKLIAKKTKWETIAGLFSINNNIVSPYAVTCNYVLQGDTLKLTPIAPLGRQLDFEVRVYIQNDTLKKHYTTPAYIGNQPTPKVSNIYPLTDAIPTNILMFHVVFSTPMFEDDMAFRDILILDDKGNEKEKVWREKSSWANNGKHLVLMVHPGRIKKGIEYMDEYGVLFEVGKKYTIVVPQHLKDKYGKPLGKEYRKSFTVTAMDRNIPLYQNEKLIIPKANAKDSLILYFSEPIDYGTAQIGIEVTNAKNEKCLGSLTPISDNKWSFIPEINWEKGSYTLKLNDYVADLASNHFTRKFEVTHIDSIKNREAIKYKFIVE